MVRRILNTLLVISSLCLASESFASVCGRLIWDAEEVDRRDWDNSDNVYVGLVEEARIRYQESAMPRIYYTLKVEEIFKGNPEATLSIYSSRIVNEWNAELQEVLLGSTAIITVGDRLLVYSNSEEVVINGCTASRVVESLFAGINERNAATLQRLRAWRAQ